MYDDFFIAFNIAALSNSYSETTKETYKQLSIFNEVFNRVKERYVEEVTDKELIVMLIKQNSELIKETFPNTMILAITSIVLASLFGILWGIFAANHKDSLSDRISIFLSAISKALINAAAEIIAVPC